jgi:hypothetical protein
MTPAKRRKLLRVIIVLVITMAASLGGRMFFFGESVPYLLLGRRPGSANPGTDLVHFINTTSNLPNATSSKSEFAGEPIRLKFDKLGGWKFIEGKTPIPEDIKKLDGKRVEIAGFIYSNRMDNQLTQFILVQSLWGCCFGKAPDMNHFVDITMESGKASAYYPDPVKIQGKLSVSEHRENGYLMSLYRLEAASVTVK